MKKRIHKYMRMVAISFMAALCISCGNKNEESEQVIESVTEEDLSDTELEEIVTGLVAADTILRNKEAWKDNDNLFVIENSEVAETSGASLYRFQDDLLMVYAKYSVDEQQSYQCIKRLSLKTGEVVASAELPVMNLQIQVLSKNVLVHDFVQSKTVLLDEMLQIQGEYDFEATAVYLEPSCEAAYLLNDNVGITKVCLDTLEEEEVFLSARGFFVGDYGEGCVAFTYIDKDTLLKEAGVLDTRDGSVKRWEIDSSCLVVGHKEGTWCGRLQTEAAPWVTGDEELYALQVDDGFPVFWDETGQIVISQNEDSMYPVVNIYSINGEFISSCVLQDIIWMGWNGEGAWFEEFDGYFFIMSDREGKERLFFWEMSTEDVIGSDLEKELYYEAEELIAAGSDLSQELYDRAAALSETYGISILIGEQCDEKVGGFIIDDSGLILTDSMVQQALTTLEKALQAYPEGFFEQLLHNHYRKIEIQLLLGHIYNDVMSSASGFVYHETPGKLIMGLQIDGVEVSSIQLEQTVYHEFSHIIDRYLEFEAQHREGALYSTEQWLSLNPDDFVYTGDGDAVYGAINGYQDYFVDDYACTDEEEDRARTMEYAMMGAVYPELSTNYYWNDTYGQFFQSRGGLLEKILYYSNCIRDSFNDTGWDEVLPWEVVTLR